MEYHKKYYTNKYIVVKNMVMFEDKNKEKEQLPKLLLTEEILDNTDAAIFVELEKISQVNGSTERSDNSVAIQIHDTEIRKLLAALREHMALVQYYKHRINP
jgi:hypothetical protein